MVNDITVTPKNVIPLIFLNKLIIILQENKIQLHHVSQIIHKELHKHNISLYTEKDTHTFRPNIETIELEQE